MKKDILLFGSVWEYNAAYFFEQIAKALEEDEEAELTLRINCDGGSPEFGMSIIEKVQELADQITIKVNAMAHSTALFILVYIDKQRVECIDTTKGVLHRAAYPDWFEGSSWFKGSIYEELLVKANKDLEKALRARVDIAVLEALPQLKDKNITVKDIFSLEARVEVILTAQDLKKLGLVSKINKITPAKSAELNSQFEDFKKCRTLAEFKMAAQSPKPEDQPVMEKLTLDELKAKFPELYAQVVKAAEEAAVTKERTRISAWMAYSKIDAEAVAKGIVEGKEVNAQVMAEMQVKGLSQAQLGSLKKDSQGNVITETPAPAKTEKEKEVFDFEAGVRKGLGLKEPAPAAK